MTSDPIGLEGGLNTYAYATGNPLKYIDEEGLAAATVPGTPVIPIDPATIPGTDANKQRTDATMQGINQINDLMKEAMYWQSAINKAFWQMCRDEEDKNCEELYQSILRTCAGLSGRKQFKCFQAAREARDQCYQERGR